MDQGEITQVTSVRLTRKFAERIDGIDLSHHQVGDRMDLSKRDAQMLIAEGWASPCERGRTGDGAPETAPSQPSSPSQPPVLTES